MRLTYIEGLYIESGEVEHDLQSPGCGLDEALVSFGPQGWGKLADFQKSFHFGYPFNSSLQTLCFAYFKTHYYPLFLFFGNMAAKSAPNIKIKRVSPVKSFQQELGDVQRPTLSARKSKGNRYRRRLILSFPGVIIHN
jgi:hypothetical protein